jgi:hypothetical protein
MNSKRNPEWFFYSSRVTCHASLLFIVLLAGCAVPYVPFRTVYEDPANFVRVEQDSRVLPERPETQYAHPADVNEGDMAMILRGILVRDRRLTVHVWIAGEAPIEPAFTEPEIEMLASRLSDALVKARPEERVTFYLSTPQTSVKRLITSGGLYVQDGRLHFTLSNYREVYGIPTYGMVYDRRYPVLPVAPKDFEVLFDSAQALVKRPFSLWNTIWGLEKDDIVIDLGKLHPSKSVASAP